MYKILLIDDKVNNNKALELLIEAYLEQYDIDLEKVEIISYDNGMDGIKKVLSSQDIDLIFLDLMMPKVHGMDVLEVIRLSNIQKQPKIVIVTALHDQEVRLEARRKKANAFITKPTDIKMIRAMLDYYMKPLVITEDSGFEDDQFLDFDDFDDFGDFDECSEDEKSKIDNYNQSHLQVSASDFLKDVENIQFIIEDFQEIEFDLIRSVDNLSGETISTNISIISESINTYASVLNGFVDFYELSMALRTLDSVLCEADFSERMLYKDKEKIAQYIKAMLQDLIEWHNHVFIIQDAIDVFYINASILSSCMQLETMIKKAYEI